MWEVAAIARPFFPWPGNKVKLVPFIAPMIPPHVETFLEAFGGSAALTAVMLALTAFAVSNLGFLPGSEINMSIFSIRTLVDFSGVLTGILVGMFCLALCRMCYLLYKHRNED